MADPITVAVASFTAIKAGVSAGREMADLAKQIGSLFDAIDQVNGNYRKAKDSPFKGTANEQAMQEFIDKKRAEDLEYNLRQIVIATRGLNAWQELIRLRAQVKNDRKAAARKKQRDRDQLIENASIVFLVLVILGCLSVIGLLYWKINYGGGI